MTGDILDFKQKREENIEKKRRNFERLLFQNFLGAYATLDDNSGSVLPITLIDISREGCLFQVPWNVKENKVITEGEERTLRMYFTKEAYIPALIKVKYSKEFIDQTGNVYMQYGCIFDTNISSFEALQSFIEFMYKFAEHSTHDHGENRVFYI